MSKVELTECQMQIKKLREQSGMNRKEFCDYFDIPYRTVTEWERGTRNAPPYVLRLLTYYMYSKGLIQDNPDLVGGPHVGGPLPDNSSGGLLEYMKQDSQSNSQPVEPDPYPWEGKPRFCPECGAPTKGADKFCKECGNALR